MRKILLVLFAGIFFWGCTKTDDGNGNSTVTVVPLNPTELKANVISTTQVDLSWTDKSTNEDGFKIQRKTGNGNFADIGSVGKDVVTYIDNGLTSNTTYTYKVYSYNSVGNSLTYSNEVSITTPDTVTDASIVISGKNWKLIYYNLNGTEITNSFSNCTLNFGQDGELRITNAGQSYIGNWKQFSDPPKLELEVNTGNFPVSLLTKTWENKLLNPTRIELVDFKIDPQEIIRLDLIP
jgi:hypothetical protein